jgi:outer membrane cobalamin receptor
MERKHQVATAVRRALVMGALTAAGVAPALAQENLGEIVVTGSRNQSANLESTTPVTQVTAQDVVTQGVTRIEDLVKPAAAGIRCAERDGVETARPARQR